jgi:hypothetical protein
MRAKHFLLVLMVACAPGIACAEDTIGPTLDRSGLEFGGRYWYSTGRIGYNYYADTTTTLLVSKLTYDQLTANAGEFISVATPNGASLSRASQVPAASRAAA